MNARLPFREALIAGILIAGWASAGMYVARAGLQKESHLAAKRLAQLTGRFIEKAYRAKDDPAMQEAIQNLAKVRSVSMACVVDKEDRVLAHNRLSQLGKTFHLPRSSRGLWDFPLSREAERWGTLVFSLADQEARGAERRQALVALAGGLLLWLLFVGWSLWQAKERAELKSNASAVSTLLDEEKNRNRSLEERLQNSGQTWAFWLVRAIEEIPYPCLLLDQRQRIIAVNQRAVRELKVQGDSTVVGRSWLELPRLQECGEALERSLQAPGSVVELPHGAGQSGIRLSTFGEGSRSATWVRLDRIALRLSNGGPHDKAHTHDFDVHGSVDGSDARGSIGSGDRAPGA
jgi:PAS domain-containing protein